VTAIVAVVAWGSGEHADAKTVYLHCINTAPNALPRAVEDDFAVDFESGIIVEKTTLGRVNIVGRILRPQSVGNRSAPTRRHVMYSIAHLL
jgi:hypothetical protein